MHQFGERLGEKGIRVIGRSRWGRRFVAIPAATVGLIAIIGLGTTGCGGDRATVAGSGERNGVRVEVRVEAPSGTEAPGGPDETAEVVFTPQQSGFHLYSLDLPERGVDGVGRPTRVRFAGGLAGTGSPTADRPVVELQLPGVSRPVPVYPDGPVTLRLPVRRSASAGDAVAVVGYAACSAQTCLPPVSELRIPLTLP